LLQAAEDLVVERGYSAVGLDEIAERAGLTKGAIYSIFGSKLALLRSLAEDHLDEQSQLPGLEGLADDVPVEDALERLAQAHVALVRRPESLVTLAFELELASLALRDPETLQVARSHETAQTEHLASVLAGRRRRRGAALTVEQSAVVADLVLALLGGCAQRGVTVPRAERDAALVTSYLLKLLP
jgi:AcrR family transcriptional regulator